MTLTFQILEPPDACLIIDFPNIHCLYSVYIMMTVCIVEIISNTPAYALKISNSIRRIQIRLKNILLFFLYRAEALHLL